MAPRVLVEQDQDGVAVVILDNPPVNALHPNLMEDLFRKLQALHEDPSIKGIVITGAGNQFFTAGFDIQQFQKSAANSLSDDVNKHFTELIEYGAKPTVAAINGTALGGGCEIAIACNARIAVDKCGKIGLPELQLGIIPGFGGTQRLPRLVGLAKGIEMMLKSQQIDMRQAKELGLIDEICSKYDLIRRAKQLAIDMANGKYPRQRTLERTDRIESLEEAQAIINFAKMQAQKQAPGIQHPQLCLEAIKYGIENGGHAGLIKEGECFMKCRQLDTHKALVHFFFAQRGCKRVKGVTDVGLKPRKIQKVAVLGGGLMGSGIVTALLLAGKQVFLKEINDKFLQGGIQRVKSNLDSQVRRGKMTSEQLSQTMSRLQGVLDFSRFKEVDMVIEAVIEKIELKQAIFADLERYCNPNAILATNTSTIDIDIVGEKMRGSRDRLLGAHFFSPAHIMPLLEIVRTNKTSAQVILDTMEVGQAIKKTCVVVGNCTGFAVNRVFFPYTMGAILLADLGMDPYMIDKVIKGMGMPSGPFRLSDLVGGDIGLHVGKNFVEAYPDRVYRSMLLVLMNEAGRLGEKTGKGFYIIGEKRKATPDSEGLAPILEKSRSISRPLLGNSQGLVLKPKEIVEFIFLPVINEGCRVVEEGIVDKPSDLDVCAVMAMGFPPVLGGLMFWGDLMGAQYMVQKLRKFQEMVPPLSGYFEPSKYLLDCARTGRKLIGGVGQNSKM